jgi:hypothetical protein
MQQSRIVKKSFLDLKNGRGNAKTHIAKIAYYLAIQNLMFSTLQQGLFAVLFHEEDEDDEAKKKRLKEKDKKAIENMLTLELPNLASSNYLVRLTSNNYIYYTQILKQE